MAFCYSGGNCPWTHAPGSGSVPTLAATYRFVQVAALLEQKIIEPGSLIGDIFPAFLSVYLVLADSKNKAHVARFQQVSGTG